MANLYIGLGGAGVKTLRELKNKKREGDYFLFVDTDSADLRGLSDREIIDLSRINVSKYLESDSNTNPIRQRVDDWLDDKARLSFKVGPLSSGASANRPQGRLAFASEANELKDKLSDLVRLMNRNDPKALLNTYIVLSVAGGTGSSIYLDITKILNDELYHFSGTFFKNTTAVLYMPDTFVEFQHENVDRYKTNVFAFWKELDAIQRDYFESINTNLLYDSIGKQVNNSSTKNTSFSKFAIISEISNKDRYAFQVFNDAILIDTKNTNQSEIKLPQLYKNVARMLEMTTGEYGDKIRVHLYNSILKFASQSFVNKKPWIKQYWSAGYAEIKGGSEFFKNYVKANIKLNVYNAFYGEDAS